MSSPHNQQLVHSRGIYHGLPTYPSPTAPSNTAIITGANGISGHYMLQTLAQSPSRWKKIICLSRRPPTVPEEQLPSNVQHVAVDFLGSREEVGEVLRGLDIGEKEKEQGGVYVFFYSYVQAKPKEGAGLWSDAEEMCRVNVALLRNFLEALPLANIHPTRIMLQTGAKNYGIHLGPTATPQEESFPRVDLEPNFYYPQEDLLWSFCQRHNTSWNVVMPSYILGAVPDAAMNLVYPLGIYAAVQKHLGEDLAFPADLQAWEATHVGSSSRLNAYFEEWAVLGGEKTRDQKFNIVDGGPFTWGNFWPKFAEWYGVGYERPSLDDAVFTKVTTRFDPPPRGFGPPKTFRVRFMLVSWARQPKVQKAWSEIVSAHNLKSSKLEDMDIDRIFGFADGSLMGGTLDMSMNKARKLGWHGFVDTNEAFKEVLGEFVDLGMLPPLGK